jgi:hypothetical protein
MKINEIITEDLRQVLQFATDAHAGQTRSGGDSNTIIGNRVSSYFFDGNIPIVRLYTKALTQEQVQQNFDAEKSRFGL